LDLLLPSADGKDVDGLMCCQLLKTTLILPQFPWLFYLTLAKKKDIEKGLKLGALIF